MNLWKILRRHRLIGLLDELIAQLNPIGFLIAARFKGECLHTVTFVVYWRLISSALYHLLLVCTYIFVT